MRPLFIACLIALTVGVGVLAIVTPSPVHACSTHGKVINRWMVSGIPPEPSQYVVQISYGNCVEVKYVQQWQYNQAFIGEDFHE